jgi:hypothetical protein
MESCFKKENVQVLSIISETFEDIMTGRIRNVSTDVIEDKAIKIKVKGIDFTLCSLADLLKQRKQQQTNAFLSSSNPKATNISFNVLLKKDRSVSKPQKSAFKKQVNVSTKEFKATSVESDSSKIEIPQQNSKTHLVQQLSINSSHIPIESLNPFQLLMDNEKTEEIALPDVNSTFSVPLLPQSSKLLKKFKL